MISIERCKEILGEKMTDSEVAALRGSLYAMVESILDNYFEEFVIMNICKNQLSIAEFPASGKAQRDTDLIAKSIVVENMHTVRATRS